MTGVILAGGQSTRMGFNKAFIRVDGEVIIERSVALFKSLFDDVFISTNEVLRYENLGVRVISDVIKDCAAIGGLHSALFHTNASTVFVAACDMPYLDAETIKKTIDMCEGFDAAVPYLNGAFHPLHAAYKKECIKQIEAMIADGNLRLHSLLENIRVRKLTEEDYKGLPAIKSVVNVNTREDLISLTANKS